MISSSTLVAGFPRSSFYKPRFELSRNLLLVTRSTTDDSTFSVTYPLSVTSFSPFTRSLRFSSLGLRALGK